MTNFLKFYNICLALPRYLARYIFSILNIQIPARTFLKIWINMFSICSHIKSKNFEIVENVINNVEMFQNIQNFQNMPIFLKFYNICLALPRNLVKYDIQLDIQIPTRNAQTFWKCSKFLIMMLHFLN